MIRINLNRSRVAGSAVDDNSVIGFVDPNLAPPINPREVGVKLVVIFLGIVSLFLYQQQNIDSLTTELGKNLAEQNTLKTKVAEKQDELSKLKDIEPQANSLNDKLKALRELSKRRITELQSMDFLQSIIPERVWLRSVHFDNFRYQVMGNAVESVDLTDFVNKLENSAYFKDVIVVQDRERPTPNGKIRDFEFTAREEAQN